MRRKKEAPLYLDTAPKDASRKGKRLGSRDAETAPVEDLGGNVRRQREPERIKDFVRPGDQGGKNTRRGMGLDMAPKGVSGKGKRSKLKGEESRQRKTGLNSKHFAERAAARPEPGSGKEKNASEQGCAQPVGDRGGEIASAG